MWDAFLESRAFTKHVPSTLFFVGITPVEWPRLGLEKKTRQVQRFDDRSVW